MIHVAKALLFDTNKKILVLRRSESHPRFANHLDFPGGLVEEDEHSDQAVAREIDEEVGLKIEDSQLNQVYSKQVNSGHHYMVYQANLDTETPLITLSWEHDKYEWVTLKELLNRELPDGVDDYYLTALEYLQSL